VSGNVSAEGWADVINAKGTEAEPFAAAPVQTHDAVLAARHVLALAGTRPGEASALVGAPGLAPAAPPSTDATDEQDAAGSVSE
jgi:hypothetical protein